jgi:MFS family permease
VTDAVTGHGAPAGRGASRTALIFMLCFVLAQADKQVMGLIALPVQASFGVGDAALGFLQGGAFAIAFAIGGLPIARLLDGGHRVRIAATCVALWSLATIFCGLAGTFAMLVAFRAATAIAEAGLPPAALSIFSQSGNRRLTARLTSSFMLAPFIGGGLVLLLGGLLMAAIARNDLHLPGFAEPWRIVFLAVGLPGLLLAPLLAWLGREPARPFLQERRAQLPSYRQVIRTIFAHRFLRHYYLGLTALYLFVAALIGWYPALLARGLGFSPSVAGAYAGLTYLVMGVAGTLCAVTALSFRKRIRISELTSTAALAALVLAPVSVLLPLAGSLSWSLTLYGFYAFVSAGVMAFMTIPIQLSLDISIQARGLAVFSLFMSAVAGSIGPLTVGLLSQAAGLSLAGALAAVGTCSGLSAALLLRLAARAARDGPTGED